MKTKIIIGIIAALILTVAYFFAAIEGAAVRGEQNHDGTDVGIQYKGHVDVYKIPADTGIPTLVTSKDNLLVDNGKNYIRKQIGDDTSVATNSTKWISLSNDASSPAAGWTQIVSEINANGLSRAQATYAANGTGAWNYTYTWTASGAQSAQLTGLQYASTAASDGNLFAALQFTAVSLQANDQLRVIWSISVS